MSREAAVETLQAQHGDQQGAHAALRRREPLQVSAWLVKVVRLDLSKKTRVGNAANTAAASPYK